MGDRETLIKISKILRRLLLVPYGACGEIAPRKGTTRRECYRALWEIQELLQTRKFFFSLPPQSNADRIRSMTDEELAEAMLDCFAAFYDVEWSKQDILNWLKQEASE
jgi:hypothetical protein